LPGEIWYTLTGTISADSVNQAVTWINGQLFQGATNLKFLVSSVCGDLDSAIRLHDYLRSLPIEVETIGFGQVDSAANLVFLGGRSRKAVRGCRFHLHEGLFTIGQPSAPLAAHQETMRLLAEILRRSTEIVSVETGKAFDEIRDTLKASKILTVEEAKDFGIVHEVIDKLPLSKQTT